MAGDGGKTTAVSGDVRPGVFTPTSPLIRMALNNCPPLDGSPAPIPISPLGNHECPSDGINGSLPSPPKTDNTSINRPKTFAEVVSKAKVAVDASAKFISSTPDGAPNFGKGPGVSNNPFSVMPNPEMLVEILNEKNRLRNCAIFFSAVELDKCPPRKFLDDWLHNYWSLKLGFHISFCRQIQ